MKKKKIGLLIGYTYDWSWPHLFIEEINKNHKNLDVEYIPYSGLRDTDECEYDVIVDRISHVAQFYRPYLKTAILQGKHVLNNVFNSILDDKFTQANLLISLGIKSPKTVMLPNKDYITTIDHHSSLRNLIYPIPWEKHVDYLGGFPLILKDVIGYGWENVFVVNSLNELYDSYNQTGLRTMILQEYINWDDYSRCLCFGQKDILVTRYVPESRQYLPASFPTEIQKDIVEKSIIIAKSLEIDFFSIEWAIKNNELYAIDFLNYVPDLDVASLGFELQKTCVSKLAKLCVDLAYSHKKQKTPFIT